MLKNNFFSLIKLILSCLILFLIADVVSELLASSIIYFKKGFFPFSWSDVFASFFKSGYVGGLILGIGIWIKIKVRERNESKKYIK
ncbi:hypothetical protein [Erwinia psidii]|uniref:Uncharacterized protein n=1 Tax=Erwinia psidii TaxID=69224 RepID=A0A3N6S1J0_9GAMM|nr:hypothetical protein [Erwinia psidii]MCX8957731.1 hypothetical protein [Erwinia psidii]RQM39458.1 hypothetical protein EB241_03225 [Erwinia psidii]